MKSLFLRQLVGNIILKCFAVYLPGVDEKQSCGYLWKMSLNSLFNNNRLLKETLHEKDEGKGMIKLFISMLIFIRSITIRLQKS